MGNPPSQFYARGSMHFSEGGMRQVLLRLPANGYTSTLSLSNGRPMGGRLSFEPLLFSSQSGTLFKCPSLKCAGSGEFGITSGRLPWAAARVAIATILR